MTYLFTQYRIKQIESLIQDKPYLLDKLKIIKKMIDELEDNKQYLDIKEMQAFHKSYLTLFKKALHLLEFELKQYTFQFEEQKQIDQFIQFLKEQYYE